MRCMARMSPARLLGRSSDPISRSAQRAFSSSLVACCVPSLREFVPATYVAPLSPRAGPHFFQPARICMADMSDNALSTELIEFILRPSLRRAPNPPPSDPVSRHRTEIVSSSRDQGSLAERISSSLALCPTLDLASASHQALSSDRAFFCPSGTRAPSPNPDRHQSRTPPGHSPEGGNLRSRMHRHRNGGRPTTPC